MSTAASPRAVNASVRKWFVDVCHETSVVTGRLTAPGTSKLGNVSGATAHVPSALLSTSASGDEMTSMSSAPRERAVCESSEVDVAGQRDDRVAGRASA